MSREEDRLISAWLDESIQPSDFVRLQELLLASASLRKRLRHEINLDMVLRERASVNDGLLAWSENPESGTTNLPVWRRYWKPLAIAAAFSLLAVGTTALLLRNASSPFQMVEETSKGSAILTRMANAQWDRSGRQPKLGDTLTAGELKLTSGVAQIEFFSGATLLVEGAADIDIISPWEVACRSGKVRALVPPPAQGFKIHTPGMELIDLGTEFGVQVNPDDDTSEVHVFQGEVEVHPTNMKLISLKEGEGLRRSGASVSELNEVRPEDFVCLERMDSLCHDCESSRLEEWKAWKKVNAQDPRLIAYYGFQRQCNWERSAGNDIKKKTSFCTGGIVGARWTQGRWPNKDALEFKRPGDRVRIRLDGSYNALTFACWVKVDGLDRKFNALLLTDGYEAGEPHWQILEDGRLMFSIAQTDQPTAQKETDRVYYSPVVFNRSNLGRWHQLAVTYNTANAEAAYFVDGREISREASPISSTQLPVVYGSCEIGNWGMPVAGHEFPIRNFNGCIDEFIIYKDALTATEIRGLYEAGRQD